MEVPIFYRKGVTLFDAIIPAMVFPRAFRFVNKSSSFSFSCLIFRAES